MYLSTTAICTVATWPTHTDARGQAATSFGRTNPMNEGKRPG